MKDLKKFKKKELLEYIQEQENTIQDLKISLQHSMLDGEAKGREIILLRELLRDKDK